MWPFGFLETAKKEREELKRLQAFSALMSARREIERAFFSALYAGNHSAAVSALRQLNENTLTLEVDHRYSPCSVDPRKDLLGMSVKGLRHELELGRDCVNYMQKSPHINQASHRKMTNDFIGRNACLCTELELRLA